MSTTERRVVVWVQHFADRPSLMLQWHDPATGRRKSRSAGTCNPLDAERARADLEYELNNGLHAEPARMAWAAFREAFLTEHAGGLRRRTREKYETVFDVFEDIAAPQRLAALTARTLSAFVKGMRERKRPGGKVGLAPITQRNYLVALKTAFQWAAEQKIIPEVPAFPVVKVPKKRPQPIDKGDFEKLLAKAPDAAWRAFLLCAWWSGLRLGEAYALRWERADDDGPWLDLDRDRIVLPAAFAKSDEDQWVPLHPELRAVLEALPRSAPTLFPFRSRKTGGPLTRNGITNRVIFMAQQAGVKLSMHRLRKGFGCRVATQLGKGNAPVLHRLMRHSSMQITMDYYASVDDALGEAMKGLK